MPCVATEGIDGVLLVLGQLNRFVAIMVTGFLRWDDLSAEREREGDKTMRVTSNAEVELCSIDVSEVR